ncbi:MAG: histone deacetylase family protein [Pseudomonadota bacterium]
MTTRLYTHPIFLEHLTPPGHPERPDRLRALEKAFSQESFDGLERREPQAAAEEMVLLAHPEAHLISVKSAIPEEGIAAIDADTTASPASLEAALTAVGAATEGVDDVFSGAADNVFVAARPPGHHAESDRVMGFCFFNQAAIAARYAQQRYGAERVAIVDWDVHHGNGTQEIFWNDKSVLYCSTHQMPLFPGTGAKDETGAGNIVNAPMSSGSGRDQFREAFTRIVLPALENTNPDLIIISSGFDAHHRDPLAEINLTAEDFDWATGKLMDIADRTCDNRLVSLLEGGYDLTGLMESASAHVQRLMKG